MATDGNSSRQKNATRARRASSRPPANRSSAPAKGSAAGRKADGAKSGKQAPGPGKPRKIDERSKAPATAAERKTGRTAGLLERISPRVAILAILLVVFVAFSFGPTMRNLQANSDLNRKKKELAAAKAETARLQASVNDAQSLAYVDSEARKQRLVAPGEVLYIIATDQDGSKIEYRVKSLQSMDEAWERVRLMLNCNQLRVPAPEK